MPLFLEEPLTVYQYHCCSCQCMTPQRLSCLHMGSKMVLDVTWLLGGPSFCFVDSFPMSSVSWTHFASPQLLGWTFGLHCKQPCGCGENTNDGATKNSQVLTFGEIEKIIWFFASRSSLGLPVQSSYGETIPHTYFTSSLRCGLHTVFLILFTELPWNLWKVFV